MSNKDSIGRTIAVALILCIVCSVVVSTAAVLLRPMQIENKELDRKINILAVADIPTDGTSESVDAAFSQIQTRLVDLSTGQFVDDVDPDTFDARKAVSEEGKSVELDPLEDTASIRRIPKLQKVYLIEKNGNLDKVIVPVSGYGLWSTMFGYIALEGDLNTIAGLTFYEHAETPGLGGEISNPKWKAKWVGKKIYDVVGSTPEIEVIKGEVTPATPNAQFKVDGLSGATLTSNGVTNLMHFWFGDLGFAPMLSELKKQEA